MIRLKVDDSCDVCDVCEDNICSANLSKIAGTDLTLVDREKDTTDCPTNVKDLNETQAMHTNQLITYDGTGPDVVCHRDEG